MGSGDEHLIGNQLRTSRINGHSDGGKDVHVVTLPGHQGAVAPAVADVAAELAEERLGNGFGDWTLDPMECIGDTEQRDLLG